MLVEEIEQHGWIVPVRNVSFDRRIEHHGQIVRIEIAREEMHRVLTSEMAAEFTRVFKSLGFKFVTLDLEGFRSGSMNALLTPDQIAVPNSRKSA